MEQNYEARRERLYQEVARVLYKSDNPDSVEVEGDLRPLLTEKQKSTVEGILEIAEKAGIPAKDKE